MSVIFLRTIIIYVLVVLALRIMGKRQLGELQPSELVVTIMVSNIATMSIEDSNVPLSGTILPIFTLVSCEVLVSLIILKSNKMQKLISGNPCILIRDGNIDQQEMKNLRWTIEDLMEQLRIKGIFDLEEVSFAIVETSGTLSVYQKFSSRPVTHTMLTDPETVEPDDPPMLLISDGEIVRDGLNYCGVDGVWLEQKLKKEKVRLDEVFLMTCNRQKNYKVIKREI